MFFTILKDAAAEFKGYFVLIATGLRCTADSKDL